MKVWKNLADYCWGKKEMFITSALLLIVVLAASIFVPALIVGNMHQSIAVENCDEKFFSIIEINLSINKKISFRAKINRGGESYYVFGGYVHQIMEIKDYVNHHNYWFSTLSLKKNQKDLLLEDFMMFPVEFELDGVGVGDYVAVVIPADAPMIFRGEILRSSIIFYQAQK